MKKFLLVLTIVNCQLSIVNCFSQDNIGVGTNNPHPSAILHLDASDKGILVPRINLQDVNLATPVIAPPAHGLMVYNQNPLMIGGSVGFWYWDSVQTKWAQVLGAQGATGPQGPIGNNGLTGPTGANGIDGATGPTGAGIQGAQGLDGNTGPTGSQGLQGNTGADGATGPQGAQGLDGPTGPQGLQGLQGNTGADGATGSQGAQGLDGPTGSQGFQGLQGNTGADGPTGAQGSQGLDGATGSQGPSGTAGATGATGPQGPQGIQGNTGVDGKSCWDTNGNNINDPGEDVNGDGFFNTADCNGGVGIPGATGPTGPTGTNGSAGATGATGNAGATGPTGTNGTNGAAGATGSTGTNGTNGAAGATGPTGTNGTNGAAGATGSTGTNGTNGAAGATGPTGTNGTNGAAGATGPTGTNGTNGAAGATGPTGPVGCGTANYIMKSNGSSAICTVAPIFEDNTGLVGINNLTPFGQLDVQSTTTDGVDAFTTQSAGGYAGLWAVNTDGAAGNAIEGASGGNTFYLQTGSGGAFTGLRTGVYSVANDSTTSVGAYLPAGGVAPYASIYATKRVYRNASTTDKYQWGIYSTISNTGSSFGTRIGAVIGILPFGAGIWGSLGYTSNSNTNYAGYFSAAILNGGAGKLSGSNTNLGAPVTMTKNVGIGSVGDFMGGWIKGSVYGAVTSGNRFGLYVDGATYTNNVVAQLNETSSGNRVATYMNTSVNVDVYAHGKGQLVNGKANINFDVSFQDLISSSEPVTVTITPMGNCNGVFLSSVSESGFSVDELNNGNSNVLFSWIAVGRKKGFENPTVPVEILSSDFDEKLNRFMFNENNTSETGGSFWWDGTQLRTDELPSLNNPAPSAHYLIKKKPNSKPKILNSTKTSQ